MAGRAASLEHALDQSERSDSVLRALSGASKQLRRGSRAKQHRHDWQLESKALDAEACKLEQEISKHLALLSVTPSAGGCKSRATIKRNRSHISATSKFRKDAKSVDAEKERERAEILAQAKCLLATKSMINLRIGNDLKNKRASLWDSLIAEMSHGRQERLMLKRDLLAQIYGMRAVIAADETNNQKSNQVGLVSNQSSQNQNAIEMGQLLEAIRGDVDELGESLHEELIDCAEEASKARACALRSIRKDRNNTYAKQKQLHLETIPDFQIYLVGYEESAVVVSAVEKATKEGRALLERHDVSLSQAAELNVQHSRLEQQMRQTETWFGDSNHDRFYKLHREFVQRGRGLAAFLDRTGAEFPEKSRPELERHLEWVESGRRASQARKDRRAARSRELSEFVPRALAKIATAIQAEDASRVAEGEKTMLEERCAKTHARLAEQRAQAAKRAEFEAAKAAKRAEIEAEVEERRKEVAEIERRRKHAVVAQLNRKREFTDAMEALAKECARRAEELEKIERAPYNLERVNHREAKRADQLQTVELERLRLAAEEREKQVRLDKIRASVPNYYKLQEIERCSDRLNQQTFSSGVVPDAAYKNYAMEGLFAKTGFTDKQVTGDVRFKVIEALRSKGLQGSAYASTLLQTMGSRSLPSKNLTSSLFS